MGYNIAACTAIGVMFPILGCILFAMRMHCQRKYSDKLEIDGILIIPAFLLVVTAGVAITYGAQTAIIGAHSLPQLTTEEFVKLNKFEYAFWIGHIITIALIKLSILFFFRRIFRGRTERTAFDIANWSLITFTILWTVTFLFAEIFLCGKYPEALWTTDFWKSDACVDTFALNLVASVFNWIIDFAILIEPLVMVQKLRLVTTRKRVQASAVFLLSALAVVAGLLRMVTWAQVTADGHTATVYSILGVEYPVQDLEGLATVALFWTYVEMGVGFMVACLLPSARVFDAISSSKLVRLLSSSVSLRSRRSDSEATASHHEDKGFATVQGRESKASREEEDLGDLEAEVRAYS